MAVQTAVEARDDLEDNFGGDEDWLVRWGGGDGGQVF